MTARLRRMVAGDLPAVLGLERELFPEDAWTPEMFAGELSGRRGGPVSTWWPRRPARSSGTRACSRRSPAGAHGTPAGTAEPAARRTC